MTDALVLFLPADPEGAYRWLRVADDAVVDRGEGFPDLPDPESDEVKLVAVAPADGVTLHWAELPDRSTAQAVAAARLLAADASAAPVGELHVAVGDEGVPGERPIGVVSVARMRGWLSELAARAADPDALVPAPMLLPRPEAGYVRADLGGEGVVRGAAAGFADEARLTELVTGGEAPVTLDRDTVEAAIVATVAEPTLDLRQGPFARRRRTIDWGLVRRLAWLGVAVMTVTLLISLFQIMRYEIAASGLETRATLLAEQGLPPGETVTDASRQLDERLAGMRGGGLGFARTAAAVFNAVQSVPGSEVTAMSFNNTGVLKVSVATQTEAEANDLKARIAAYGFTVEPSVFSASNGQLTGDFTVTP